MKVTTPDAIAGYAAVVATAALGWQVWNATRPHRPDINVGLDVVLLRDPDLGGRLVCRLVVRNRGSHRIRVEQVAIRMPGRPFIDVDLTEDNTIHATVPGAVEPSDAGIVLFRPEVLREAGVDLRRPVEAYAQLSTQEGFWSPATRLRLIEDAEEHPAEG